MRLKEIKRISKFYLSILLFSLLSALTIVGCIKTEGIEISSEDEIQFTVGSMPNTKTAYDPARPLQLIWVAGDQVSIFCDQAGGDSGEPGPGKTKADYDVTPDAKTPEKGTLSKAAKEGKKGLRWNDDNTIQHNLYAVYPSIDNSNESVSKVSEGFFTFDFPKIQECSIAGGYTAANGSYMLKPQMYLAYMVAKQERLMPTNKPAVLHFKPIATTLEITLQGAAQEDVEISRLDLEVIVTNTVNGNASDNDRLVNGNGDTYQIQFNAKNDYSLDVYNSLVAYPTSNLPNGVAYFSVKLPDGEGKYTIAAGESVTFTVFLPPIKNLDDVLVKCIGSDETTLGKKQIFINKKFASPASKSFFKLPPFPEGVQIPSPDSIVIKPSNTTLIYGLVEQLQAIAYYPDGTITDITFSAKWEYIGTAEGAGPSANTAEVYSGMVILFKKGTSKITASYNGMSDTATIKPHIYKEFTIADYYQWDAWEHYDINNWSATPPWGAGSSFYNPKVNTPPEQSCMNAVTKDDAEKYLGAEKYYTGVNNLFDGYIYTGPKLTNLLVSDSSLYCQGLWLNKGALTDPNVIPSNKEEKIPLGRPPINDPNKWLFLPSTSVIFGGRFQSNQFGGGAGDSGYWLSTPEPGRFDRSYHIMFGGGSTPYAQVFSYMRSSGFVRFLGEGFNELKLESVKVESTTGSYNVEVNKTLQMKATAYFSDKAGTKVTRDVTNESTWTSTSANVATVDNTTIKGNVKGLKVGASKITAEYKFNGETMSDTKTVNVLFKIFTVKDFYQWDAWEPCDSPEGRWGPGSSGYNPTMTEDASKSCKYAMTLDAIKMYLAAGVFWVTDGPTYQLPNGNILGVGLMIKKCKYITGFKENEAEKVDAAYDLRTDFNTLPQSEKDKYFFLPISGSCSAGGTYGFPGYSGRYWLSTHYEGSSNNSYEFVFSKEAAYPAYSGTGPLRRNCYLPLIGVSYDSTYVEPKKY